MKLLISALVKFTCGLALVGLLIFLPAGTLRYLYGWLLMGLPAVALMTGLAEAFWTALGLAIGTYINWLIVAKRIRLYSSHIGAITLPEFFSKRFGDKKNLLSLIAGLVILVFFLESQSPNLVSGGLSLIHI